MTNQEFFSLIDDILEATPGTVKGNEMLADLGNWDSLAVVGFIASVHALLGVTLEAKRLKECKSVPDLLSLVQHKIAA